MLGIEVIDAYSSGSRPSGKINKKAIASMKEVGYDLASHTSKSLNDIPEIQYDYVITMGCGDECPLVNATTREEWEIPDPKYMETDQFNEIRDTIKKKVASLIERVRCIDEKKGH